MTFAIVKDSFALFQHRTFEFLGFEDNAKIIDILSTEDKEVQVKTEFSDLTFKTDKNYGLHIEKEVDISKDDLLGFAGY